MKKDVNKNKKDVREFLSRVKNIDEESIILLNRSNNKGPDNFLVHIGYDYKDLINEVRNLKTCDYLRCQIDTKNEFYLMYSFLKIIKKYIVYIKLSVVEKKNDVLFIISFHKAEKDELSLRPFKEDKNG